MNNENRSIKIHANLEYWNILDISPVLFLMKVIVIELIKRIIWMLWPTEISLIHASKIMYVRQVKRFEIIR
jgi:hypothetical protein